MTDLLNDHWVTAQSPTERQSLPALDAYIDPPAGEHGFVAAARAEEFSVGPVPLSDDDNQLWPLVEHFNEQRAGSRRGAFTGVPPGVRAWCGLVRPGCAHCTTIFPAIMSMPQA